MVGQVATALCEYLSKSLPFDRRTNQTSWGWCPNGEYCYYVIYCGLLSLASHVYRHVLFCTPQHERFHQPFLHRSVGKQEWIYMELCWARYHCVLLLPSSICSCSDFRIAHKEIERHAELGGPRPRHVERQSRSSQYRLQTSSISWHLVLIFHFLISTNEPLDNW